MVSLFASSVRTCNYDAFFDSLEGTDVKYEVVFAGNAPPEKEYKNLRYIITGNIKPAQCYEIARRDCKGEVLVWVPDDAEFHNNVIGKAYRYWMEKNNKKLILSIQTREFYLQRPGDLSGLCDMTKHTYTGSHGTPLMAPIGMISRAYVDSIGGIDQRYVCGQWDNDIVMQAYQDGFTVEIFGDKDCCVEIDHIGKFEKMTGQKGFNAHRKRPFGTGYAHDRSILETMWGNKGQREKRTHENRPFVDKDIMIETQSHKGIW